MLEVFGPVVERAAAEAPAAIAALREEFPIENRPIGVIGGSMGSSVALLVLAEGMLPVAAAALISPVAQPRPIIREADRWFGVSYAWTDKSHAAVDRMDFVARAAEIVGRTPQPAVLLVTGARDAAAFREPAAALRDALLGSYAGHDASPR